MTQKELILNHLKNRKTITPIEALHYYQCFRLASVVNKLKADGYEIITQLVSKNGKHFARYNYIGKSNG